MKTLEALFSSNTVNIKRLPINLINQYHSFINKDVNYISHQPSIVWLKLNSSKNSLLYTRSPVPKQNESFARFQTLHVIVLGGI